jgi:hypothetical protein
VNKRYVWEAKQMKNHKLKGTKLMRRETKKEEKNKRKRQKIGC